MREHGRHQGTEKLRITWDESAAEKRGNGAILARIPSRRPSTGALPSARQSVDTSFASAAVIETEYAVPYLALRRWSRGRFCAGTDKGARRAWTRSDLDQAYRGVLGSARTVARRTMMAGAARPPRQRWVQLRERSWRRWQASVPRPVADVDARDDPVQGGVPADLSESQRGGLARARWVLGRTIVGSPSSRHDVRIDACQNGSDATCEGANRSLQIENLRCDCTSEVACPRFSGARRSRHAPRGVLPSTRLLRPRAKAGEAHGPFGDDPRFNARCARRRLAQWSGTGRGTAGRGGRSSRPRTYVAHIARCRGRERRPRGQKVVRVDAPRGQPDIVPE